jgi:hypothetical protein
MGSILYFYFTGPIDNFFYVMGTGSFIYVAGTNSIYGGGATSATEYIYFNEQPIPSLLYGTVATPWSIKVLALYTTQSGSATFSALTGINSYTTSNQFANSHLTGVVSNGTTMGLTSLAYAFYNCINLNMVPTNFGTGNDNITNMTSTFYGATNFNQNISEWNFANVTDFSNMFYNATSFNNGAISGTSNTWSLTLSTNPINMQNMFVNAVDFNSNISAWNTSTVTSMQNMFVNASSFNKNLGSWDVSNCNMQNMFVDIRTFNSYTPPAVPTPEQLVSYNSMSIANYDATLYGWANQTWTTSTGLFTTNCLIYTNAVSRTTVTGKGMIIAGDVYIPGDTDIYSTFSLTYNYQNGLIGEGFTTTIPDTDTDWRLYIGGVEYGTPTISSDRKSVEFTIPNGILSTVTINDFPLNIVITCPNDENVAYYFLGNLPGETACFNEGTKILYMNKQIVDQYIRIELLKPGDFVKTFKHGYRKIDMIGKNVLINTPTNFKKCMYKMEKTYTNGLIADLIVTGGHSILVDEISDEERVLNEQLFWGPTPKLDNKYLLLSAVSSQFKPIKNNKKYTYYHLVLENEDVNEERYGIWANGILTETPSKDFFKKQRFMLL